MKKRRVVITGLGIVCPVGNTIAEAWRNILNGTSGIATLENIDTEGQSVTFGGSVKNFDVSEYLSPKEAKKMDIFIHYGMAAGIQAIEDSGIEVTESNAERIGVAIGAGIGGLTTIERTADLFVVCVILMSISGLFKDSRSLSILLGFTPSVTNGYSYTWEAKYC